MHKTRALVFWWLVFLLALTGCGGGGGGAEAPTADATLNGAPGSIRVTPNSPISTDEAGLAATISVSLGSKPVADVTIPVSSSDTSEGTVDKTSLIFTKQDWATAQTITVTGVADSLTDGDMPYVIKLGPTVSTNKAYNNLDPVYITVTNLDARAASFVVSAISGNTSEGGTPATFTVRLGSQPADSVTIPVQSSDPTEGTISPSSLTFTSANWDQDQTVTVTGVADPLADGNQVYDIKLGPTVSIDSLYNNLNPSAVTVTNLDVKIPASFVVSAISGNTSESGSPATFTVRLGSQPDDSVTIPVKSSDATEGTIAPSTLTFTTANWDQNQTVTVTGVADSLADGNQVFVVELGPTVSNDSWYNNLTPSAVSATNLDVRTASFVVSAISGNTSEGGTAATFTVRLGSATSADVTIPVQSSNTSEGTVSQSSLLFTPANWDQNQTITVTGVDDSISDNDQIYSILLGPTESTDSVYHNQAPGNVSVSNLDVKTGLVDVVNIPGDTDESGGQATFQVRLYSQPAADVAIPISSSDTTEGTVDLTELIFTSTNWAEPQTVTVTGVNDPDPDSNIGYSIQLGLTSSTDDNYNDLDPIDIGLTNIDMKTGSFAVAAISGNTDETGMTATFEVRLNSQPEFDVVIPISSADTSEGTVDQAELTFTKANWDTPQTVTVTGVNDSLTDGDITYNILLGMTLSTDDNYNGLNPTDVAVTNLDVWVASFEITAISGNTDESGRQAIFKVRLGSRPSAAVTIQVSSSNTNEGTVSPASLTFTSADWDQYQTVTVTGVDDAVADGNQSYTIVLESDTADPADVTVTNVDLVDSYSVAPRISAGPYHNLVLASDGTVWGWGPCEDGQLDSTTNCSGNFILPQRLNITKAAAVSAGYSFSVIVKSDGSVWTSGANGYGQLGHAGGLSLAQVDGLTDVDKIATGTAHVLALKNDGTVWAWGSGVAGQLGNGVLYFNSQTPVQAQGVLVGKTITAIAAGDLHSLALDNSGNAYAWGSDAYQQLGLVGTSDLSTPTPTLISRLKDVTTIAAGQQYSFAVGTSTSSLVMDTYGWGSNNDGQLATTSGLTKSEPTGVGFFSSLAIPSQLAGGTQHSLALYGNTVYAWGDNDDVNETYDNWDNRGVLGNGGIIDVTTPAASFAGASATAVSTGAKHSLVLLGDGRMQATGINVAAQLGTNEVASGSNQYTTIPKYVEDPGDGGAGTVREFYAYRPILSGQPATATTFTTATVAVCPDTLVAPANCGPITYYKYSTDQGVTWSTATPIAIPINLSDLAAGTVNLWVKGMTSETNEIQTDDSAVKVSWTVN